MINCTAVQFPNFSQPISIQQFCHCNNKSIHYYLLSSHIYRSLFLTTGQENSQNLIRYDVVAQNEVTLDNNVPGIGTHLAVDTTNQAVYWIHFTTDTNYKIYKTTYGGETSQIGPDQTGSVNNVDIAEGNGYFYILDSSSSEIRKYDKTTHTISSTIPFTSEITGIIVVAGKCLLSAFIYQQMSVLHFFSF